MTIEDEHDTELNRRIAEALRAQKEAERQAAADATARLEAERGRSLAELSREAQKRNAEAVAERRLEQEERSRRYDAHMARVQPEVDQLLAQIADLAAEEHAERERSATVLAPLSRRKIELARQIAALQEQPADDASPEPSTARARLRALVGGCS